MNLRKSYFSLAIYKNNLKRFKWGSFLYGLFLFFSVPFVLLVSDFARIVRRYNEVSVILREDFMIFPMLFAVVIPTIAAALIFNNVHSSRQSVFVHSLPVTRRENYISDILSGLTLMGIPVIANGIILLVMSFARYGAVMPPASVVYWIFLNLSVLFIMFSLAAATAFLTGNTVTHIGINAFFNAFPLIVALTISVICDEFLYGFVSDENFIANTMIQKTPIVWLFGNGVNMTYPKNISIFLKPEMWMFIAGAVAVYFIGYLLYKVRKVELSGDVVAFSVFRPIFKYLATASCAAMLFSILVQMEISLAFVYIEVLVGAAVVYFACEMLMNKSFRVFGSYKGFLGFVVAAALVISFFSCTSVFGYETRVPELSETEGAAIYTGRHFSEIPFLLDAEFILATSEIHESLIENPFREKNEYEEGVESFYVSYKLKNGKVLRRFYTVSKETYDKALSKMYESEEYKFKVYDFDKINIENVNKVLFEVNANLFGHRIEIEEKAPEFLAAVRKDVLALSYGEIENRNSPVGMFVRIDCTNEENARLNIFKPDQFDERLDIDPYIVKSFDIKINENFENTFNFLKENGYFSEFMSKLSSSVWIYKKPITLKSDAPSDNEGKVIVDKSFEIKRADCAKLSREEGEKAALYLLSTDERKKAETGYFLFLDSSDGLGDVWFSGEETLISKDELPVYLRKYIE